MNPITRNAAVRAIIISALGIAIGFLGELMPDTVKTKIESFAIDTLGLSYVLVWAIGVGIVTLLTLAWVCRDVYKSDHKESLDTPPANGIQVEQHGAKSVFINKNEGGVNIH
ncbi:MAG: hypothetical protein MI974_23030 [Chitinophagales bacterium]|nr:hypothetical protein [Chitinophagales bacterium]